MGFHVWDGDRWWYAGDRATADLYAQEAVDAARDCCDPEWPTWVDEIRIHEGPEIAEEKDELPVVAIASECNVKAPEEGDGSVDFYCDYEMRAPIRAEVTE